MSPDAASEGRKTASLKYFIVTNDHENMTSLLNEPTFSGVSDEQLGYRRGTARRDMLVNSCYVSRAMGVRKVLNN